MQTRRSWFRSLLAVPAVVGAVMVWPKKMCAAPSPTLARYYLDAKGKLFRAWGMTSRLNVLGYERPYTEVR